MNEETIKLKSEVHKKLVPFLEEQGFEKLFKSFSKKTIDFDFLRVKDGFIHVLAVQFQKDGKPRFHLTVGEIPEEGCFNKQGAFLTKENLTIGSLFYRAYLQRKRGPFINDWFDNVDTAIQLYPQLEDWWAQKVLGLNVDELALFDRIVVPETKQKPESLALKKKIIKRLIPFLEEQGFAKRTKILSERVVLEDFIRIKDGKIHILGIVFDFLGKPRVKLEAGEIPEEGWQRKYGPRITKESVNLDILHERASLQAKQGDETSSWFRSDEFSLSWCHRKDKTKACVDSLLANFYQLDEWWAHKKAGPNIVVWRSRFLETTEKRS